MDSGTMGPSSILESRSFESDYARVQWSFHNLWEMYTERRVRTLDSAATFGDIMEKENFMLRMLIHIKNHWSSLLTPGQLKDLDAMLQSLEFSRNEGWSTEGLVSRASASSAPPKLEEMIVSRNRVESNQFSHPSFTQGNAKPSPIKKHHGSGATMTDDRIPYQNMVGVYDASLQCGSGATMVTDCMPSKNVEGFFEAFLLHNRTSVSSNQRPNSSGNTNNVNDIEVSSSSIGDNAPKGNSGSSSDVETRSSGSSKSSSSEIQSSDAAVIAQEKRRDTSKHKRRFDKENSNRFSDDSKNLKIHKYRKPLEVACGPRYSVNANILPGKAFQNDACLKTSIVPAPKVSTVSLTHPELHTNGLRNKNDEQTQTSSLPSEDGITGILRVTDPWGDIDHLLDGYNDQKKAAIMEERTIRIEQQKKLFAAKKLSLVLDLDHTLLNSAMFSDVDPILDEKLRKNEEQDREKPQRHLFRFENLGLWTKFRPGVWNFLEKASKLFELHIYTMGNRLYATEMAKVLDPNGTLFGGRVVARGDDVPDIRMAPKIKDLNGVLGMESGVVIIDDCSTVWPHNKHNLIVVERYTYFPSARREFGLPGKSLLEIDRDESVKDGSLASSLSVIERIHGNFFYCNLGEVDVRTILSMEQRKILEGCRILFSGIFFAGDPNPHLHPLWQTAEQFGAVCTIQIDDHVTHVVANLRGTDKVKWALSSGRFVVQPGWVEASALLYRRAKEQDFALKQ